MFDFQVVDSGRFGVTMTRRICIGPARGLVTRAPVSFTAVRHAANNGELGFVH